MTAISHDRSTNPPEPCEWCGGQSHPRLIVIVRYQYQFDAWASSHGFNPRCRRLMGISNNRDRVRGFSRGLFHYLVIDIPDQFDQLEDLLIDRDFRPTYWRPEPRHPSHPSSGYSE